VAPLFLGKRYRCGWIVGYNGGNGEKVIKLGNDMIKKQLQYIDVVCLASVNLTNPGLAAGVGFFIDI